MAVNQMTFQQFIESVSVAGIAFLAWLQFVGYGFQSIYHAQWLGIRCYPANCWNPLFWRTTSGDHVISVVGIFIFYTVLVLKTRSLLKGFVGFLTVFAIGEFYFDFLVLGKWGPIEYDPAILAIALIIIFYPDVKATLIRTLVFALACLPAYLVWKLKFPWAITFTNLNSVVFTNAASNTFANLWPIGVWTLNFVLYYLFLFRTSFGTKSRTENQLGTK